MRVLAMIAIMAGLLCIVLGAYAALKEPMLGQISGRAWLQAAGVSCLFSIACSLTDRGVPHGR